MRIELNSGGFGGISPISNMQENIDSLLQKSETLVSALQSIRSYTYGMNGGVGILQDAVSNLDARLQAEETKKSSLTSTKKKIGSFVEYVVKVDTQVADAVDKNQEEFYNLNPWAKPPQKEEKEWYEKFWDGVCSIGTSISETAQKAWDGIKSFYSTAKEKLNELFTGFQEWWKDHMTITPVEIKSEVFDDSKDDYYGSRQHGPAVDVKNGDEQTIKDYTDIIRENTGKTLTKDELLKYLDAVYKKDKNGKIIKDKNGYPIIEKDGLNSEGCEYAAIVNTIFEYYVGRENGEQEFYNKFGYPLRDANGNLNYNYVLVDMYSKYDDPNFGGLTDDRAEKIIESYMGEAGKDGNSKVNVDMETGVPITVTNVDNYLRSGKQVIISTQNVIIRNEDGSELQDCNNAGHSMVVTGVTPDGRYIVSTWGGKGYIDPKKQHFNTKLEFSTVQYSK